MGTVCKYWEAGTCRYGQNCRFEHPSGRNRNTQSGNRFATFAAPGTGGGTGKDNLPPYSISKDTVQRDLTTELPQWILSAYGPGKDPPEQLFGGPGREQSFEEMRLLHMMGEAAGNPQQAINEAQNIWQRAQQQNQTALQNLDAAIQFINDAVHRHPNRLDVCKQHSLPTGTTGDFSKERPPAPGFSQTNNPFQTASSGSSSNPFSNNAHNNTAFGAGSNAFGQPSALGQKPNPFGTPAFGQPSQPSSAFGQASQASSAFGQQAKPASAFGQAGQAGQTSSFGQTSALGQKPNPFGAPAFGQPSQPAGGAGGPFGQPSQPTSTGSSPFGQPSQSTGGNSSAFGQPSALGAKPNPFGGAASGPSPFAATSNNATTNANPFGQATQANNSQQPAANPFSGGQATQKPSPFGAPSQPAQSNPFGQPPQSSVAETAPNPFGQPAKPVTTSSPFGQPAGQPNTTTAPANAPQPQSNQSNPFTQASQNSEHNAVQTAAGTAGTSPYPPGSAKQHPVLSSYASKGINGQLSQWKGKPVTYKEGAPGIRAFDGSWARIWFPNGPPTYYKDTEVPVDKYDQKTKVQWQAFETSGKFEGGMPALPPPREACLWDI